jgi:hypothetical protein
MCSALGLRTKPSPMTALRPEWTFSAPDEVAGSGCWFNVAATSELSAHTAATGSHV